MIDCILCETNYVDDEIHFILFCSKYTGGRQGGGKWQLAPLKM